MSTHYSIPELIDSTRVSAFQCRVFALCFFVAILDGFDTQAIAFTGPSITQAFGLGAGALAPILTAGIDGMVLGVMALGRVGAIIGSASGGWFLEHGGPAGYYSALIVPLAIAAAALMIIRTQPDARASQPVAAH